jgi:phosphate uptake regulator
MPILYRNSSVYCLVPDPGGMETRKVQITGGSTFTVSLPKEWARANGVEAGSSVAFYPDGDSLVITPSGADGTEEGALDVSGMSADHLKRAVMTMYVSGFDVIALEADRITAEQRRAVREATQSLVGLEVLEETAGRVVVQDLLDSSELSITNAIDRMRLIASSMLEDAITALAENDDDLARDVIERDDDVDRLWFVVSRTFRASLRAPSAVEELGLPREVCFDYHSSARQLERIADHAAKIGQRALDLEEIPSDVVEALEALHDEAAGVMATAMDALTHEDADRATELANEAREAILGIDDQAREIDALLRDLEPEQARNLGLVVDSLSRSADYGGNIAETALQKAAPRP